MHWAIRSSKWMMISQILRLITAFWLGIWMIRVLAPSELGIWSTMVAWCGVAACVVEMGLRQVVLKFISQRPRMTNLLAGTVFRLWTISGLASAGVLAIVNLSLGTPIPWAILLAGTTPLIMLGFAVHHLIQDSRQRADIPAKNAALSIIIAATLRLCLLIWMPTLTALAWAVAAESILLLLLAARTGQRNSTGWLPVMWNGKVARALLSRGLTMVISHLALILLLRMDVIMLERMRGTTEVGIYTAATRLSELFYAASPMLATLLLPKLSQLVRRDFPRFRQIAAMGSQLMMLLACGSMVILQIGNQWVVVLLGPAYAASSEILLIHCIACLPYFFMEWRYAILVAMDRGKLNTILLWVAVICNFVLNLLWIPQHGALGSAWATLVAYSIGGFLATWFVPSLHWLAIDQAKALLTPLQLITSPLQNWQKFQRLLGRT